MKRFCFRGQYKDEAVLSYVATQKQHIEGLLREGKIYTVTVFSYDNQNLFVYYECAGEEALTPTDLFPGITAFMQPWPGEADVRWFVPMIDIYHSMQPNVEEEAAWHRTEPAKPKANMSQMKLDLLSSYIFYHVQLQEEKPAHNGKHMSIWQSEHIALLYHESPDTGYQNPQPGKLTTKHTPSNWRDVMVPHFNYFDDGQLYHSAEVVFTLSEGDLN